MRPRRTVTGGTRIMLVDKIGHTGRSLVTLVYQGSSKGAALSVPSARPLTQESTQLEGWNAPVRVIAGSAKGRVLKAPPGLATRPTADKVKGALFNILAPRLADSYLLDLFAGTGALSIEALSRGAAGAILVESARSAQRTIIANLEQCRFSPMAQLVIGDVEKVIPRLRPPNSIDLVMMDPPYHQGLVEQTLTILGTVPYLAPHVMIVAEHHRQEQIPDRTEAFVRTRVVTHGDTSLSFFVREEIV